MARNRVRPEEYQCRGKQKFFTRSKAKRHMKRLVGQRSQLQVYRCPHCGFWHLGRKIQ